MDDLAKGRIGIRLAGPCHLHTRGWVSSASQGHASSFRGPRETYNRSLRLHGDSCGRGHCRRRIDRGLSTRLSQISRLVMASHVDSQKKARGSWEKAAMTGQRDADGGWIEFLSKSSATTGLPPHGAPSWRGSHNGINGLAPTDAVLRTSQAVTTQGRRPLMLLLHARETPHTPSSLG